MKKLLLYLLIFSKLPAHEHKVYHHPKPLRPIVRSPEMEFKSPEVHLTIDIPNRPPTPPRITSPRTPQELRRLKLKLVALTAIVTTIITGGVTLFLGIYKCKD